MEIQEAYKYCPICSSKFELSGKNALKCTNTECNYVYYINPKACVCVVLEDGEGRVVFVKRKYDPFKDFWDIPGGFVDANESLENAALREIKEELSIDLESIKYFGSYPDTYLFKGIKSSVAPAAFIGKVKDISKLRANDDATEFKLFRLDEIKIDEIAFDSMKNLWRDYLEYRKNND